MEGLLSRRARQRSLSCKRHKPPPEAALRRARIRFVAMRLVIRRIVVGDGRGAQSTDAARLYSSPALLSITYLALAEHTSTYLARAKHTSPGRHLGSYDIVIAPALSIHAILALAALAFVGAVLLGAF